ncbi:MAG: response regulator transcription factor [Verrucomicrobia bacterium]|nr:response regulator transcription factor [Verrucomicrobiota bacterium]MDE3099722.1 response regulator transcription factor [Verrucomicrobiota bacterium]
MPISVSIVEDDGKTRDSILALLRRAPALQCLDAYATAEVALIGVVKNQPDVLLVDIHLPGMNGIECVAKLKAQFPALRILMLTTYEDSHLVFNSLRAGASGYILKNRPPSELVSAIEQVHEGGAPMTMRVARKVVEFFKHLPVPVPDAGQLSERESQVLTLLAGGGIYKEIADRLKISENTVRTYVKRIYEKLHVHSRREAVARFDANKSL